MSSGRLLTLGLGSFGSSSYTLTLGLGAFTEVVVIVVSGCVAALDVYQSGPVELSVYQGGPVELQVYIGGMKEGQAGC